MSASGSGIGTLVASDEQPVLLWRGAEWAEGPAWIPWTRTLRFSDIPGDRILEWHYNSGVCEVFASPVGFTNGRTVTADECVIQCSHGHRQVELVEPSGKVRPTATHFGTHRLNSPNDVVVGADASVWFTDPRYGIRRSGEGYPGSAEYGGQYVFRLDSRTGELEPVITDLVEPNGLAFSPDRSELYVTDTSLNPANPAEEPPVGDVGHHIYAYSLSSDRIRSRRLVARISHGVPDGIRVDKCGNIWSSAGDGVHVFAPSGTEVLFIPLPEVVSNLCFGGPTGSELFVTTASGLYVVRTLTTDAHAW